MSSTSSNKKSAPSSDPAVMMEPQIAKASMSMSSSGRFTSSSSNRKDFVVKHEATPQNPQERSRNKIPDIPPDILGSKPFPDHAYSTASDSSPDRRMIIRNHHNQSHHHHHQQQQQKERQQQYQQINQHYKQNNSLNTPTTSTKNNKYRNDEYFFVSEPSQSEDASNTTLTTSFVESPIRSKNNNINTTNDDHHQLYHHHHHSDGNINNSTVVGNDINIHFRKSLSNTSLSSLGSPGVPPSKEKKSLNQNHHYMNSNLNLRGGKKSQLYFPSFSSSSTSDQQQQQHIMLQQRIQVQYSDIANVGNLLDNNIGNVGNKSEDIDDELLFDSIGNNNNDAKKSSEHRRSNSGGSTTFIAPRAEPIYLNENNAFDVQRVNSDGISKRSKDKDYCDDHDLLLDDGLSEVEVGSQEHEIINSLSLLVSERGSHSSDDMNPHGNIQKDGKKGKTKSDNDDDLSYDTSSSQTREKELKRKNNNRGEFEIESPPKIEKSTNDLSKSPFRTFDVNEDRKIKEVEDVVEDGDDSITPKRKTSRSSLKTNENMVMTEADHDSKPSSRAQRKRVNSDGKRAPKHRRKKSGDEAAATLLTGSPGWAGMELYNLPIPSQENEDDDEDDIFKDMNIKGGGNTEITENRRLGAVINSEGRSHGRPKRRSTTDMPLTQMSQIPSFQGIMPMEEFSRYALGDAEGENLQSSSIPHQEKVQQERSQHDIKSTSTTAQNDILETVSVGSAGSHGTAFSWISNKISLLSQKDHDVRSKDGFDHGFDPSLLHREFPPFASPIPEEVTSASPPFDQDHRAQSSLHDDSVLNFNASTGGFQHPPLQPLLDTETKKREYFSVATVPKSFGNPISFMIMYFVFYIILALVIFGLEEGWPPLDCLYFAVMTLTTTGLGDYVPTKDNAKIVCSIFMYFGVACVGLLLGLLHANFLDNASQKTTEESMMSGGMQSSPEREQIFNKSNKKPTRIYTYPSPRRRNRSTRNSAEEIPLFARSMSPISGKRTSLQTIDEGPIASAWQRSDNIESARVFRNDDNQSELSSNISIISIDDKYLPVTQIRAAKYIILTLKQASANTLFIIGIGSLGFIYFEQMTTVDAFYFTMSLLTTVGYGDIVPKTPGGKLFASFFTFIAWICLLYNISMISMIPLELRKRRIENAVLNQFGDELDDETLHELISGPLVKRLSGLNSTKADLDYCSREMFSLTMLIRLGRISEQDVRSTFAAFQKLDKNNEGFITKKDIQGSMFDNVGNLLPKQRNDTAAALSESSTLLHPLTMSSKSNDYQKNYMSLSKVPELSIVRGGRQISTDSLWSVITDENYDENPKDVHNV